MQLLGVGLLLLLRWGVLVVGLSQAGDPTASLCLLLSPRAPPSFPIRRSSLSQFSRSASAAGGCQGLAHATKCTHVVAGGGHVQCGLLEGASWT